MITESMLPKTCEGFSFARLVHEAMGYVAHYEAEDGNVAMMIFPNKEIGENDINRLIANRTAKMASSIREFRRSA